VKRYIEAGDVETKKESGRRFVRDFSEGQKGRSEGDTAKVSKGTEGTERKGHDGEGMSLHAQKEGQKGQKGQSESVRSAKRDTAKGTRPLSLLALSGEAEARDFARLRADLEREREGAAFLRGVIEQLQRDGAEVRAALRKALELAPKQLAAPSPVHPDSSARNPPQSGLSNKSGSYDGAALNGPQRGGESLSYGDVADLLDAMEREGN
jgi:hypothetical protein